MRRRFSGYTLVELAVVLVILGVIGLLSWRFVPVLMEIGSGEVAGADRLAEAGESLEGFALARDRLPCPDTSGDGEEDCNGADRGHLPWQTLGLARFDPPLRYGVFRVADDDDAALDADLAAARDRYQAPLPPDLDPPGDIDGLDFCVGLLNAAGAAGSGDEGLVVGDSPAQPVAWALHQPTGVDEPGWSGEFPLPDRLAAGEGRMRAAGAGELAGRQGCPTRLATVNASSRAAYAARDMDRAAAFYTDYRAFGLEAADGGVFFASFSLALAGVGLVNAIATTTTSISFTANTAGVGAATILLAIADLTLAAVDLGMAAFGLAMAVDGRDGAVVSLCEAGGEDFDVGDLNLITLSTGDDPTEFCEGEVPEGFAGHRGQTVEEADRAAERALREQIKGLLE